MNTGRHRHAFHSSGFTFVELMVTLAVLSISLAVAVPSFRTTVQDNRQIGVVNELVLALQAARSEATKRRDRVTVCGSSSGSACNSNDWEDGWIVFVDEDGMGDFDAGTDELVLVQEALDTGISVRASEFAVVGRVQYDARGRADDAGTFTICDGRGPQQARAVTVARAGRVEQARDIDGNGVVESGAGNVSCPA